MKVAKLIARLQEIVAADPDVSEMEVRTEGCDCYGDVGNVSVEDDFLVLYRS